MKQYRPEAGDKVKYTPIKGGETDGRTYTVRMTGKIGAGVPVVWLEEKSGCVALWAVVPA